MQPFDRIEDPAKLRRLLQAIVILDSELNLPVVLRRIIEEARDLVDAEYGALGVLTEDGDALDQFITVGFSDEDDPSVEPRPTDGASRARLSPTTSRCAWPTWQTARAASKFRSITPG